MGSVTEELIFKSYFILINLKLNGSSHMWLTVMYWTKQHLAKDPELEVESRDRKVRFMVWMGEGNFVKTRALGKGWIEYSTSSSMEVSLVPWGQSARSHIHMLTPVCEHMAWCSQGHPLMHLYVT